MADLQLSPDRLSLLDQFRQLADSSVSLEELQRGIVQAAAEGLPHFNWTGFYMLDPADAGMLVLGPFVGDPTPHVRIPVNQGICGAAVESGETVVVDDVGSDLRYLSCSIDTKSEIVVPIRANGRVVGEVDIDSHDRAAFGEDDRAFLEEVARIVARHIEKHAADSSGPQSESAPNP
jgi:L-methionine (R)-S-oxide reductase